MFVIDLTRYIAGSFNAWYLSYANPTVVYIDEHIKIFLTGYTKCTNTCCCAIVLYLCLNASDTSHKRYKLSTIAKDASKRLKKLFNMFFLVITMMVMLFITIPKTPNTK